MNNNNSNIIQGPHCLIDIKLNSNTKKQINTDFVLDTVNALVNELKMQKLGEARIIRGHNNISAYQIVSTSHIILHFSEDYLNADLFSCEPFDVDRCVSVLTDNFGNDAIIQYCQRNLSRTPSTAPAIQMKNMNEFTSNKNTFTHALINWYDGNESLLGDIEHGVNILKYALNYLNEGEDLPPANILFVDVDPIDNSWDKGGFSGGYINLLRQLTMHTFVGINGAYTDIMAYTYNLEKILDTFS